MNYDITINWNIPQEWFNGLMFATHLLSWQFHTKDCFQNSDLHMLVDTENNQNVKRKSYLSVSIPLGAIFIWELLARKIIFNGKLNLFAAVTFYISENSFAYRTYLKYWFKRS